MALLILLVILAVIVLWIIAAYNGLVALKNQVANAWKQIDVQLKRRHDLIPNLVNTVKGAMDFERSTLEAVISARNKAVSASGVAQTAKAEGELTQALGRLFALTEAYPDLKATGNVAQLQEELTSTENKIGFARQLYNDTATQYNTKQATFPTMLVAGLAKATPAELWQITDDTERAVPAVDLFAHQTDAVSADANLFAQQEANRRRSTWLVIGFIVFFAWVGFGGDVAYADLVAQARDLVDERDARREERVRDVLDHLRGAEVGDDRRAAEARYSSATVSASSRDFAPTTIRSGWKKSQIAWPWRRNSGLETIRGVRCFSVRASLRMLSIVSPVPIGEVLLLTMIGDVPLRFEAIDRVAARRFRRSAAPPIVWGVSTAMKMISASGTPSS